MVCLKAIFVQNYILRHQTCLAHEKSAPFAYDNDVIDAILPIKHITDMQRTHRQWGHTVMCIQYLRQLCFCFLTTLQSHFPQTNRLIERHSAVHCAKGELRIQEKKKKIACAQSIQFWLCFQHMEENVGESTSIGLHTAKQKM